jgi:hypothetical protein
MAFWLSDSPSSPPSSAPIISAKALEIQNRTATVRREAFEALSQAPISPSSTWKITHPELKSKPQDEWTEEDHKLCRAGIRVQILNKLRGIQAISKENLLRGTGCVQHISAKEMKKTPDKSDFFRAKAYEKREADAKPAVANITKPISTKEISVPRDKPSSTSGSKQLMQFGKHSSKTIEWVMENDEGYFNWATENVTWFAERLDKLGIKY